jgi:hypothetical protein
MYSEKHNPTAFDALNFNKEYLHSEIKKSMNLASGKFLLGLQSEAVTSPGSTHKKFRGK